MTVAASDLQQYVDKKVTLVRNTETDAEEQTGTVLAVSGDALMFKPKGKTNALLIEASELESIEFAQESARKLSRKTLKPITHGQARAHLLERHGYKLSDINAMSETEAFKFHESLDHEALDLGHVHGDKDKDEKKDEDSSDE